jgi:hypothetical protein
LLSLPVAGCSYFDDEALLEHLTSISKSCRRHCAAMSLLSAHRAVDTSSRSYFETS